jgi:hypothetical protein
MDSRDSAILLFQVAVAGSLLLGRLGYARFPARSHHLDHVRALPSHDLDLLGLHDRRVPLSDCCMYLARDSSTRLLGAAAVEVGIGRSS